MFNLSNYLLIKNAVSSISNKATIIAVSKSFPIDYIRTLIDHGHNHFGENKVQEAQSKWTDVLKERSNIKLHMIGKLQSNKAKDAFKIFDYIHTLDNQKIAQILSNLESDSDKKLKYFIQVNIAAEEQKTGIDPNLADDFIKYCRFDLGLNIIGLMCLPPVNTNPIFYFKKLKDLANENNLLELSMGMTNDYIDAIKNGSTYLRIGSGIFGSRSN
jgi:pyridoxal phosphate enzyme (YggS family)